MGSPTKALWTSTTGTCVSICLSASTLPASIGGVVIVQLTRRLIRSYDLPGPGYRAGLLAIVGPALQMTPERIASNRSIRLGLELGRTRRDAHDRRIR